MSSAGFVALAGRPNVGKSTFINAVVNVPVAIVSDKPQTTRRAIRGVSTAGQVQIVFVDLPGVQRPRDAMTRRMARRVELELDGADAALMFLNARQGVGPGDRFIAKALSGVGKPVTIAVNKIDGLSAQEIAAVLLDASALGLDGEIFPICARKGTGLEALLVHLRGQMKEGPLLYDSRVSVDEPLEMRLSELVREALLRRTFAELPHASEVVIEEVEGAAALVGFPAGAGRGEVAAGQSAGGVAAIGREPVVRVVASIWVESESQKRIVIGAGGRMVKAIGVAARKAIARELDRKVHLDLTVKVRRDWRADEASLDRLGIE